MKLHAYGLTILDMQDNLLRVRLACDNNCCLDICLSTNNYNTVKTELGITTYGSELFKNIVKSSGLDSFFRKEIRFHELHEYFHTVCFAFLDNG